MSFDPFGLEEFGRQIMDRVRQQRTDALDELIKHQQNMEAEQKNFEGARDWAYDSGIVKEPLEDAYDRAMGILE